LFRPLASDIVDEADHHATRCREPYPEKYDYIMVPELPNQFSALVNQVMVKEAKHWHEQSSLQMNASVGNCSEITDGRGG